MMVGKIDEVKDKQGNLVTEKVFDKLGNLITTKEYTYIPSSRAAEALSGVKSFFSYLASLITGTRGNVIGASHVFLKETFYLTLSDGSQRELCRTSEGIMMENVFMPDLTSTAVFDDFTGLEGATFNYIIGGDTIITFSINENLDIIGEIPAAQLGFSYVIPSETEGRVDGSISYDAYSIGVKLDGARLLVDGNKAFHINGAETKGALFMSKTEDGINEMFLYNGSEIKIVEDALMIERGTALFGMKDTVEMITPSLRGAEGAEAIPALDNVIPPEGKLSPLQRLDNLVTLPAIADDNTPEYVEVTENTTRVTLGNIEVPESGIFEIIDNKVIIDRSKDVQLPVETLASVETTSEASYLDKTISFINGVKDKADWILNPGKAVFDIGTELGREAAPEVYNTMKEVIKSAAIGTEKNLNRIAGLGPYTAEDFAIDKAWALESARSVDLDGAIVFAVGRGPVQSITRFGELSGFGESKRDVFNFLSNPSFTIGEYGIKYLWNALTTKDMVPHHVGMAKVASESAPDGTIKNYIMQINPEGRTKVLIQTFAQNNLTIKIIMPERGASDSAKIWDRQFKRDPETGIFVLVGRITYDFFRLVGWGDDSKRGTEKAICSEDVYFMRVRWAREETIETKTYVDPLPGIVFDNRVTPWDMYKPRDLWDKDMVQEFVKQNLQRAEEIARRIRANMK